MTTEQAIAWYDANARTVADRYEGLSPDALHGWFSAFLPDPPGLVIDIGAGSGRDAAWFAAKNFRVVAVEPSKEMRTEGQRRHASSSIQWISDKLPALSGALALGLAADVVHLGAVWMHLPAADRPRAFRKIVSLTRSGGLILITVRNGPADAARGIHSASVDEIERLARGHGLVVVHIQRTKDLLGREDVCWDCVALRLPDDGTDALPILRQIILNDSKTTTYKLGLLRSLCRAAESASGMAMEFNDYHVAVPLGVVALNWLRLYLPLIAANLPQSGINKHAGERLDFCKDAFKAILAGEVPAINLRPGAVFSSRDANIVHAALKAAANTVREKPAHFTTFAKGGTIFPFMPGHKAISPQRLTLDAAYLSSFGRLLVPRDMWRAMQRFGAWIEPSIIAEWIRLMEGYATGMDRRLDAGAIAAAVTWIEPDRDVAIARGRALALVENGSLFCVWSGRKLDASTLDMDHALPWSAWPCGDLWNLVPAHRRVNQCRATIRMRTARQTG